MMTATVANDHNTSTAGRLLVIHEFDQWDGPTDLDVTFSGVCWAECISEPTD